MKAWQLGRKVNKLSEKIKDTTCESIVHLDFESFSEAEKLLFKKVDEVEEEYLRTGNKKLLEKNSDLILKNIEVMLWRVTQLYCSAVPLALACYGNQEIVEHFFELHFMNFEADLAECLANVRTWSEKDCEDFRMDIKKNGRFFFRIPRGFNEHNTDVAPLVNSKKAKPEFEGDQENETTLERG